MVTTSENQQLLFASPFAMVIFGATGDLSKNKLIPALFSLYEQGVLPENFHIVGFARRPFTDEEFANLFSKLHKSEKWKEFCSHLMYQQGNFEEEKGYLELIEKLNKLDEQLGACIMRIFYLATPPQNYETILDYLDSTKLSEGCGQGSSKWTRLAIEKPFGKDIDTARHLDQKLSNIFEERQIFRVDHYLAKETVQNILAFRFANGIFEPVWNNKFIDHVQITWGEKKGVSGRGKFFDGVGLLRDVAQNHLLQLAASVAMEQPTSFTKEGVRDARAAAINAITPILPQDVSQNVVRGQAEDFVLESDVNPDSTTETYVALKLFFDTQRMKGVPFYIRAGKEMPEDVVEISVVFIQTCHILFKEYGCPEIGNVLTFHIQPDEGIGLRVIAKKPGTKLALGTVDMKFTYTDEFGHTGTDAYERLLLDIMHGDQMLFNRSDELASSWEFITNILKGWESGNAPLFKYKKGTWGPEEAEELLKKDFKNWL